MKNLYTPELTRVKDITIETRDVKTLRLEFEDERIRESFSFTPGQFVELSVPGVGEATFCLASSPRAEGYIECSVKRIGKVTEAIHMLDEGNIVGIRGPYGNNFPIFFSRNPCYGEGNVQRTLYGAFWCYPLSSSG